MRRVAVLLPLLLGLPEVASAEPPRLTTRYLDVSLKWSRGKITVEKVEAGRFDKPTALKRYLGRFEARATAKGKPVDSVRFDFPLLGDADVGEQRDMDRRLKANLSTVTKVRVPVDGADAVTIADTHDPKSVNVNVNLPANENDGVSAAPPAGDRPPR